MTRPAAHHAANPLADGFPTKSGGLAANRGIRRARPVAAFHREQKIGNCAGCFFCWVRSPGLCTTNDDNRAIAAKIVQSDLAIYLTPVTFGGYSSALKCMVDHQIQNILPFFVTIGGEIHHQQRYGHYPNALVIGWMDTPDAAAEAVFRHLVKRNAINMYARTSVCGLAIGNPPEPELVAQTEAWLEAIVGRTDSPMPALPVTSSARVDAEPVRRAVLLVGSPRTIKSTSASLGSYLMAQLAARGIAVEVVAAMRIDPGAHDAIWTSAARLRTVEAEIGNAEAAWVAPAAGLSQGNHLGLTLTQHIHLGATWATPASLIHDQVRRQRHFGRLELTHDRRGGLTIGCAAGQGYTGTNTGRRGANHGVDAEGGRAAGVCGRWLASRRRSDSDRCPCRRPHAQ
jgi:NAD(P)H-dependent FMN reductase